MSDILHEEEEVEASPSGSMMERIREQHKKLQASKTIDFPLPGYEGVLVVRYRVLDVTNEIKKISRKIEREFRDQVERQLYATLDSMALACVEIFGWKDDALEPLAQAFGPDHPPVRFDEGLVEFMQFTGIKTSREVILAMFDDMEPMILEHGNMLQRWMGDTTRTVNELFAGNL